METENRILIRGDAVFVQTVTTERTVRLPDLLERIRQGVGVETPCLPKNCRFYVRQPSGASVFVIEEPPQVRTLIWNGVPGCPVYGPGHDREGNYVDDQQNIWRLAFPYCVFVHHVNAAGAIEQSCLGHRVAPLESLKDALLASVTANIYLRTTLICTGDMVLSAPSDAPIHTKIDDFQAQFWGSPFNADLCDGWYRMMEIDERYRTLATWQEATRADPTFPLSVTFAPGPTLERLVGREAT